MPSLYFKAGADNNWSTLTNWFTDAAATTQALFVPWTSDNLYKDYDLVLATGEVQPPAIQETDTIGGVGFVITGDCSIAGDGDIYITSTTPTEPSAEELSPVITSATTEEPFTEELGQPAISWEV